MPLESKLCLIYKQQKPTHRFEEPDFYMVLKALMVVGHTGVRSPRSYHFTVETF